ncbi:MAG: CBS domain-containing protein [Candidatus Nanoarchaeia archaeon]
METGIKVGDLMTRNFIYVNPDTNLKECSKTMVKKRVGSLIVKENNKLKGILTEKDILWAIVKKSKKHLSEIKAKDLMKRKVITIKPSADITEAMKKMKKKKLRRLPVIENKKVIGIITTNDILKIEPSLFELFAENMKIKEESDKLKQTEKIRTHRKQGECESCGEQGLLFYEDGMWICADCYNKK